MRWMLTLAAFGLSACAAAEKTPASYISEKGLTPLSVNSFDHCHGYGCKFKSPVTLNEQQIAAVKAVFMPPAKNAAQERERLSEAIGLFEREVGAVTGTKEDHLGTFYKVGRYQHDCVDESINTTTYMMWMRENGLMHLHDIEPPNVRIPLVHYMGKWPHQSAVIREIETGQQFAVDSWFHHNGAPAEIVTLQAWKDGWKPAEGNDTLETE